MLSWSVAVWYGAAGGLIVEVVFTWRRLYAWQEARHAAVADGKPQPAIARFVDPGPDAAAAISRAALGAAAGWLLRGEVTGIYAALTVGASAPALLGNLGKATTRFEVARGEPEAGAAGLLAPGAAHLPSVQPEAME